MTRRSILAVVVAVFVAVAPVAGCNRGDDDTTVAAVARDGSPRIPDDQGVLTAADPKAKRITIDGTRTYPLADNFISFSTYTPRAAEPLVGRVTQYVLVGVKDGKATWMAGVAAVTSTQPPTAHYVGRLVRIDGKRAIFRDGTVLDLADGVADPGASADVIAKIDVAAHKVMQLLANGGQ